MGFPRHLLTEDEELVLDLRPHWIALVGPSIVTILLVVGTWVAIEVTPDSWPGWVRWATFGGGVLLFLAYPIRELIAWITSHFVLTNERLIHRSGWFAKRSMEIPLGRINDVSFHQNVLERVVGAGDLVIESGGEYGQNQFSNIRHPERVQKMIYERYETSVARTSLTDEPQPARPPDEETPLEQIERLAALKEKGLLSEEEFETQKRRLLGRL